MTAADVSDHPLHQRPEALAGRSPGYASTESELLQPVSWPSFWEAAAKPRPWLVEPFLARGEIVTVYSPPKVGKSLLAQEIAACLARGSEVLGVSPEVASVLYVDQEGTELDWRERLEAFGLGPDEDLSRLHLYDLQPWERFDTPRGGRQLINVAQSVDAALVVIDTVSKVLSGEENSSDTLRAYYLYTLLPLKKAGIAVLQLDHVGKNPTKGARGSSAKVADVDAVWSLTSRERNRLTLHRTHGRRPQELEWLHIGRNLAPVHHVLDTVDLRFEERVAEALTAIRELAPEPGASARGVAQRLSQKGKGFQAQVVRQACARYREETSPEPQG